MSKYQTLSDFPRKLCRILFKHLYKGKKIDVVHYINNENLSPLTWKLDSLRRHLGTRLLIFTILLKCPSISAKDTSLRENKL